MARQRIKVLDRPLSPAGDMLAFIGGDKAAAPSTVAAQTCSKSNVLTIRRNHPTSQ